MNASQLLVSVCCLMVGLSPVGMAQKVGADKARIATEMEKSVKTEMLNKWYPLAVDTEYGGFLSAFTYDFKPTGTQDKMIVTQARHVWTTAKAAERYPAVAHYKRNARHGFQFLRDVMWDKEQGGFYTLIDRKGTVKGSGIKEAYGNAFGLYALSAYYHMSSDTAALNLAKKTFYWLEQHSHDPVHKGYFQHLGRDGTPIKRDAAVPSTSDLGYKDQNSSIHLLEALTELYTVWPDPLVRERLTEMLLLVRDTITTPKGNLVLFFQPDWTPVSFRDSSEAVVLKHRNLDHVSFGHDVETAYLMLEASHVLGLKNDTKTLQVGKRMVDHALTTGWDKAVGGFYDQGYYFSDKPGMSIINESKNWWSQAEGLNTLLLMANRYPNDPMHYFDHYKQLWNYCQTYLIDHEHGDWYEEGLDKDPQRRTGLKGHIWKAAYHTYRALTSCVDQSRVGSAGH
ncbi:AGE family epimerase/isomerase [Spirosoma utsteinense]|uniref:Mannobiose 2-epimerase n=1 Tax=Spirosoma utsteinense TaxID=2585773 RepID=A0ABR6WDA9_9BACT|nr:AGE family epimerase/isomerase [Spirosoma utsteinense]MBC3787431.1 mannobiose 2-epimerase [Spirosoma utsteinense]MBC3794549.1 mannobiose 2-epimerase [Spirosoma utsteinense]